MKQIRSFNALLMFAMLSLVSCKASVELGPQEVEGSVKIFLGADSRVRVSPVTKAGTDSGIPSLEDLIPDITSPNVDSVSETISLCLAMISFTSFIIRV